MEHLMVVRGEVISDADHFAVIEFVKQGTEFLHVGQELDIQVDDGQFLDVREYAMIEGGDVEHVMVILLGEAYLHLSDVHAPSA